MADLICRSCRRPVPEDSPWVMQDGSLTCSEECGRREYERMDLARNALPHVPSLPLPDVHQTQPR